jgi:hypothetical protein
MAARDKKGQEFAEGQKVKVSSKGPSPWSEHKAGDYEGVVIGVHEQGPHVQIGDGDAAYRIAPLAAECEIV